jgi:hypothetical protein
MIQIVDESWRTDDSEVRPSGASVRRDEKMPQATDLRGTPYTGVSPNYVEQPRGTVDLPRNVGQARDDHRFLVVAYIVAVIFPVIGILIALYTAVAERTAAIRRHAIAIAGVALIAGGGYFVAISAITSSQQDRNVVGDLRLLLDSNSIPYDDIGGCVQQSGNQYICAVTQNGQPISAQVTDDGKDIYEQGISP